MEILRVAVGMSVVGTLCVVSFVWGRIAQMNDDGKRQAAARRAEWARGGTPMCQDPSHAEVREEEGS